jgi:hypothetical protein
VVTILVATPVATVSPTGDVPQMGNLPSLGQIWSGWRDLNSRPLDPQSSALPSCATARRPCSRKHQPRAGTLLRGRVRPVAAATAAQSAA